MGKEFIRVFLELFLDPTALELQEFLARDPLNPGVFLLLLLITLLCWSCVLFWSVFHLLGSLT